MYVREQGVLCLQMSAGVWSIWSVCRCLVTVVSVRHIAEQVGDGLAIVGSTHCLREHHADINASNLVTVFHSQILGNGIGDNYCFKASIVDPL